MNTVFRMVQGWSTPRNRRLLANGETNHILHLLATQDSLSDNVLVHLKSYKYSSVDKSLISRYILKHYVLFNPPSPFYGCSDS